MDGGRCDCSNAHLRGFSRHESCGGYVNKTDSGIRATHVASGISVKVQRERSQHANKRLAVLLIAQRLDVIAQSREGELKSQRRLFHHQVERGNAVRVFAGLSFERVT